MSPFELLRFEATPVAPGVAVVELDGRFTGLEPTRPRLLLETGGVERELPALEAGGSPWSAVFAVPLAAIGDPAAAFSLIPGRGPVIALPAPSDSPGDDDRFVRLARTANDLRHRLGEATERAATAAEQLVETGEERDGLAADLASVREQLAAAEARAAEAHDAAVAAREEQARAEGEADVARSEAERDVAAARAEAEQAVVQARSDAERQVAEARAAVQEELERTAAELETARAQLTELQNRVVAAEDEARAARRDLRDARARVESLLRENRTARIAAARARVPSATPGDRGEFRAARLGPEWADGSEEEEPTTSIEAGDEESLHLEPSAGEPATEDPATGDDLEREPSSDDETVAADPAGEDATLAQEPVAGHHTAPPGDDTAAEPTAGDAPTTASLDTVEPGSPGLWSDEDGGAVRGLRRRTNAARLRPAPALDDDEETGDNVLDPAAVGARAITPAQTGPRHRALEIASNPRVIVGGMFALLLLALILIFNGVGLV